MLGVIIITKTGLLVFSHAFVGSYLTDIDLDLQAGLMTAILNAFKETQREPIRAIQHQDYRMLLYEGVLTNGILYTTVDDPKLHSFLRNIVLKFELMYTAEIHTYKGFRRADFEAFRDIVKSEYSSIIEIDVIALAEILEIMQNSSISNFVIYETRFFHPIFTSLINPTVNLHIERITQIFREINYFGIFTGQDTLNSEIRFKNIEMYALRTPTHYLLLFYFPEEQNINDFIKELHLIKKKLAE